MMLAPLALVMAAWTPANTGLEIGFASAVVLDVALTSYGLDHGLAERNPLLGRKPSRAKLVGSILLASTLHLGISALLPEPYRVAWQTGTLAIEVCIVTGNATLVLSGGF